MKKFLVIVFVFIGFSSFASHIVGGEIYYDSLGNGKYKVTFEVYRDCSGSGYDNPLWYTVFYGGTSNIQGEYFIALPIPDTLPIIYDDPCVTPPSDVCIERAIYIDTINLNFNPEGYYITYQRCCWANSIQNIISPGSWGITITTFIPGTNLVSTYNNSARFIEYPPIALCTNNTLSFDHSAYDADGDSLVYSLCTPLTVDVANTSPQPELPEPYSDVPWDVGFNAAQPLGPGSSITLDPQTGMMDITPNQLGTFVASVCVEEWRDGALINMKSRTFGYRVVACDADLPVQVDFLGGGGSELNPVDVIEDCGVITLIITRNDSTEVDTLQIIMTGVAINGIDIATLPTTLIIPTGVMSDTLLITPLLDGITEGGELLIFTVVVQDMCGGDPDTTIAYINIVDYINMTITSTDSINICDDFGEWGELSCAVQNGVPPYEYYWQPLPYANNDTLNFPATDLNNNLNLFNVTVGDQCGKIIQSQDILVYNQCPLWMPNVITANGDNVNDFLIVGNLEDYDRVRIQIFNRWGNLLYESDHYQNDWKGIDKGGQPLKDGVYYYTVTPESDKFEYDDQQKTIYTAHGFFHIVR